MATGEETINQILAKVRKLPVAQRARLLQEIAALPQPEQVQATAQRLRDKYRMRAPARRRMSALLDKGNVGTLTDQEKNELDRLVAEFEQKTLELAQALVAAIPPHSAHQQVPDKS